MTRSGCAASEVATFICDASGNDTSQLLVARGSAVANATAEGFARAVASIAADCTLSAHPNLIPCENEALFWVGIW